MANFAVIENATKTVVNIIVWEGAEWLPPRDHFVIESDYAQIGDTYDENEKIFHYNWPGHELQKVKDQILAKEKEAKKLEETKKEEERAAQKRQEEESLVQAMKDKVSSTVDEYIAPKKSEIEEYLNPKKAEIDAYFLQKMNELEEKIALFTELQNSIQAQPIKEIIEENQHEDIPSDITEETPVLEV